MTYFNEFGQGRLGWRSPVSGGGGGSTIDADAQAFITAASITDTTQQSAINTLVTQLKTYGIWTKMKALYPFVGGTASSHKWNLKDPRDLDAAYRLVFNGGGTHSATGYVGNASNAWANTFLNAQTNLTNSNLHLSFYSRTASPLNAYSGEILVNAPYGSGTSWIALRTNNKTGGGSAYFSAGNDAVNALASNTLSGFFIGSETSNVLRKLYRNGSSIATNTTSDNNPLPSGPITLLGYSAGSNSGNESAFASIGDGLTDTEAANFYTAVQTFQTTLGRQVGVPIVADTDAQAFLNAAVITDQTQANAVNTLVTSLKSANIWNKMKAIYPFVGGTATTHKFNLKDPRDLDAAYRLVFNGGWTHSSTGVLPNGTNAWADTKLVPSTDLSTNSGFGWYSITNSSTTSAEMGALNYDMPSVANVRGFQVARNSGTIYVGVNSQDFQTFSDTDTRGFYQAYRTNSTTVKTLKNTTLYTATLPYYATPLSCYIGARNERNIAQVFSNKGLALAYFQSNFTDADATALYNAVQAYQTTLGRQI